MHKLSIYKALLLEMKKEAVIAILGAEDGNKLLKFTQDDSYHHLVVNTVRNREGHTVEELLDAELLKRFKELNVSTAWNTNKTLTAETAGASITLDKQTSGYNDFVRFTEIKSGLTTKTDFLIDLIDKNYERDNDHFNILINDSEWYIVYPKTQLGSMSLGRSYWDREKDKLKYDETFDKGKGIHTGEISWCTVVNGPSNRFISYHTNMKLHMFYCISKRFGAEDNKRKLCLSLEKIKREVKFYSGRASVDANDDNQDEEFFRKTLGSRYDELIKHTKDNLEEIDHVKYYSSYNLPQYTSAFENPRVEVNIEEAENELQLILQYTKDEKIFEAMFNSERNEETKHRILGKCVRTTPEMLHKLAEMDNTSARIAVASNTNTLVKTLDYLSKIDILLVKIRVACNRNTSSETLDYLSKIDDQNIQGIVASHRNTSSETLDYLSKIDKRYVQHNVILNKNTSPETLRYLAEIDKGDLFNSKMHIARNPNCPEDLKKKLKDERIVDSYIKKYIKLLLN